MRRSRSIIPAVLIGAAVPACGVSHGLELDGGPARARDATASSDAPTSSDAPIGPPDAGPWPFDAGLYRVDASGWDGGPVGDRAGEIWEGYVEATTFPSGSDAIRIVFDSAPPGDGPRTGIVVFGAGTHPPRATDPDALYPPGYHGTGAPYEGFEYPIASASVEGSRVRALVHTGVVWADWCALQTPYPFDEREESWGCLPNTGARVGPDGCHLIVTAPEGRYEMVVDCDVFTLCTAGLSSPCECTREGCIARMGPPGDIELDFHVVGTAGDGTIIIGDRRNVHLTRR